MFFKLIFKKHKNVFNVYHGFVNKRQRTKIDLRLAHVRQPFRPTTYFCE